MDNTTPSPFCQAVCKSGKTCNNYRKVLFEGKSLCTNHYNILRMKEDTCAICFDSMTKATSLKVGCGHFFHTKCLTKWAEQGKDTFPMCREPLDTQTMITVNKQTLHYIGMLIFSLPGDARQEMLRNVMNTINRTFESFEAPPPFDTVDQTVDIYVPQQPPQPVQVQQWQQQQQVPQEYVWQRQQNPMIPRVAYDEGRPIYYEVLDVPPIGMR